MDTQLDKCCIIDYIIFRDILSYLLTLALVGGELSVWGSCRFIPVESAPGTHWIGGRRFDMEDMEKRKFLALSELELRLFGLPAP
jgi:hypothetical protein